MRTMFEAGKSAQLAAEMKNYNLDLLDICETNGYSQDRRD